MYQSLKSKPIYGVFWNYLLIIFQNELYSQRKLIIWIWNKDGILLNETSCNSFNRCQSKSIFGLKYWLKTDI